LIKNLQKEFDEWTLSRTNAELNIALAAQKISGKDLTKFQDIIVGLKDNLGYAKYRPHSKAMTRGGKWLFKEFLRQEVIEGDEKACEGCHKSPVKEPFQEDERFCERCSSDTRIGRLLPKAGYLAFFNDPKHDFEILNHSFEIWEDVPISNFKKDRPYLVMALNNTKMIPPITGFKYLANHLPTTLHIPEEHAAQGQPVSFNAIANESRGDKLLGYVKGDVDNMGKILREGFKDSRFSISRFTTLSRSLETFFSGFLQIEMERPYDKIYTIFSGGDDFFVVGPWDAAVEFVKEIRKKFTDFCAENPGFTFSAGVVLAKPPEPISYCAEMVNEKLKESKRKEGKSGVTIFDQTLGWDELRKLTEEASRIIEWLKTEPPIVTRGFLHNLREYGEMAQKSNILEEGKELNTEFLRFIPLLVYDVKRNLATDRQRIASDWTEALIPNVSQPRGGPYLKILRPLIEYVLTYTRS
jgi:CRISPR-associated protein Csm1